MIYRFTHSNHISSFHLQLPKFKSHLVFPSRNFSNSGCISSFRLLLSAFESHFIGNSSDSNYTSFLRPRMRPSTRNATAAFPFSVPALCSGVRNTQTKIYQYGKDTGNRARPDPSAVRPYENDFSGLPSRGYASDVTICSSISDRS